MNTYIVTMSKFERENKHSYVLGCYSSKKIAKKYAEIEEDDRGGKYKAKINKKYDNVKMNKYIISKFKKYDTSVENSLLIGVKNGDILEEKYYKGNKDYVFTETPLMLWHFDKCDTFYCIHNHTDKNTVNIFSENDIDVYDFFTQKMQDFNLKYNFLLICNNELVDGKWFKAEKILK